MKKLKLSESQVKMIQEYEKSLGKKKVLKITKEHYDALFSVINETSEVTDNFNKYGKGLGIKYESHPAEGSYVPQSEKENEKTHDSFNESISEDIISTISESGFMMELVNALKALYTNPSQEGLSPFWVKIGVTWGDLVSLLTMYGLATVATIGGNEVLQFVKSKKLMLRGVKYLGRHLWNLFSKKKRYDMKNGGAVIQDEGLNEYDDNLPAGAANDPNAPWNQEDPEEEEPIENETPFDLITYNDSIAILKKYKEPLFFVFDIEGESKYWSGESDDDIIRHMNELYNDGMLLDYMEPLDLEKISYIEGNYPLNNYFKVRLDKIKQILMNNNNDVEENTTTGSVGGSYVTPKIWAKSKKDMKFANDPMYDKGKIVEDEPVNTSVEKPKRGPKPLSNEDRKLEAIIKAIYKAYPELKNHRLNLRFVIGDALSKIALGIDERTGQVKFDDCVKLNNNKEAQNGGCSTGAVDNVVKVDETVLESVAKQTGKTISEVRDIILNHKKTK